MARDAPDAARARFEEHDAFAGAEEGFDVTTTPFEATATVEPAAQADAGSAGDADTAADHDAVVEVSMVVPTLDAVVADERVGEAVEEGWHSTLSLRLEDAYDVAEVEPLADHAFDVEDEEIHLRFRFATTDARRAADEAKAVADFVEGTYLQGVIPGYEYEEPVASMLARATETADGSSDGAERGGTPL